MHKFLLQFLLLFGLTSTVSVAYGFRLDNPMVQSDSAYTHIPKRAALWSTFIPGAGQLYNEVGYRKFADKKNRAWWKVPLIYGGLSACGYYFYYNNKFASLTKQEFKFRENNNDEGFLDERFANYPNGTSLIQGFTADSVTYRGYDSYANRRDLFMVGFIAIWGLNVLEAYVDGHFVSFDVSEDLSLSWYPTLIGNRNPGVGLRVEFN